MPITFPSSPSNGQTHTVGARTWTWSGTFWELNANTTSSAFIGTGNIADSAITSAKIASNAVTAGKLGTDVQLGYRNVVINGAMQVAQRGTSVTSITGSGYRTADRFTALIDALGTWTQTVENDAPTGSGFRKSLKMLCTTADATPAAADYCLMAQVIEGQNLQQFLKGTASAKQFTLTFWVKSNVTGTHIVSLYDFDNNRQVSASYTVSASATWEKKTITFPADTTGAFDNDNAASLQIEFWLSAGSNRTSGTLNTVWGTSVAANVAVGQTNVAAATNNYWQITGVQLEAGSVATPFEFEDYSTTLAKCQRYYWVFAEGDTSPIAVGAYYTASIWLFSITMPVTMRAVPTSVATSGTNFYMINTNGTEDRFNTLSFDFASQHVASYLISSGVSGTAGHGGWVRTVEAGAKAALSAEL